MSDSRFWIAIWSIICGSIALTLIIFFALRAMTNMAFIEAGCVEHTDVLPREQGSVVDWDCQR